MSVPWYLMAKGKGGGGYKTASGPIVSVNDALAAPLRSLLVKVDPVQAGSGDPSPDNVRPISGWSAVNAWRTGVNMWDEEWELGQYNSSMNTVRKDLSNNHIRSKNPIPVKPNTTYYMNSSGKSVHLIVADTDGNVLYRTITLNNGTFTTPSKGVFVYFNMAMAYGTTYNHDISINYPSTDTAYHAYTGTTYPIQLGQTVYGGTPDVLTGVLTVDRAMAYAKKVHFPNKVTGTVMDYRNCSGFPPTASMVDWNLARQQQMSNMAKIANPNTEGAYGSYVAVVLTLGSEPSLGTLRISEDLYQSMTDDDAIEVVYKLLNPITIPLTATQISTLAGQNVLWADAGDVTLEYLAAGGADPDLMKLAVAFMGRE